MIKEHMIQCTGCGACVSACSHKCISMKMDEEGFFYPHVDTEKCVSCDVCENACPVYHKPEVNDSPADYYGLVNKDNNLLKSSTSGGFFISAALYFISQGGYVSGCIMKDNRAIHVVTSDINTVKQMQGSKYVQSDLGQVYIEIKELLKKDVIVLFTGTPCQIGGLICFLGKKCENLYTVEVICHGVPSPLFLSSCVEYYAKKYKLDVCNVLFRRKDSCAWGDNFGLTLITKSGSKYIPAKYDAYYRYFLDGSSYRESCYNCQYALEKRVSDITIGDFWGVNKFYSGLNFKNGISILSVNSQKGRNLLERISDLFELFRTTYNIAIQDNPNLVHPSKRGSGRDSVYIELRQNGYKHLRNRLNRQNFIKNIIPKHLKERLKKILRKH